ncbi:MAG: hypothetical protein M1839_001082 [Geoglossum umbratile]|nr:MAG: hypothetical protein M1839_001082 [Geoglossum umbratile]
MFARILSFGALSIFFTGAGFVIGVAPGAIAFTRDSERVGVFEPADETSLEIERYINEHPLALALRANPDFTESRPTLQIPEARRAHNLTAGLLAGPGKIVVPPLTWSEREGKSFVAISYLGPDLCGHPGVIHGGLLATMLDEGLARCCFPALPNKVGVTATLSVTYRRPTPAGSFVALRAKTVKVEGRKAWVEGHIETLPEDGEEPVVLAEASGLFIEPKNASYLRKLLPSTA